MEYSKLWDSTILMLLKVWSQDHTKAFEIAELEYIAQLRGLI